MAKYRVIGGSSSVAHGVSANESIGENESVSEIGISAEMWRWRRK